jgi:hypothetical protein
LKDPVTNTLGRAKVKDAEAIHDGKDFIQDIGSGSKGRLGRSQRRTKESKMVLVILLLVRQKMASASSTLPLKERQGSVKTKRLYLCAFQQQRRLVIALSTSLEERRVKI